MKHRFCLISLAFLVLLFQGHALFAATLNVPSAQYPTIQSAIDAAVDGDTVLVADGVYTGAGNKDIDFKGKAITVRSENGPENCVIDCEGTGRGFHFHSGEGYTSVLSGFTITNGHVFGSELGGGIYCVNSSPRIIACVISNNVSDGAGGGIACRRASPNIFDCSIIFNVSKGDGGGVYSRSDSSPNIESCVIENNEAYSDGGGIYCGISSPNIIRCTIAKNVSRGAGGGVYGWVSSARIINTLIVQNAARHGGGIGCANDTSLKLINCTVANNTADISGGGLLIYRGEDVKNSIVWFNTPEEISSWDSGPKVTYSNVRGGHDGEGNIDSNPMFVSETNYRLRSSSACIDAGTANGAPDTDIDGTIRPKGNGYDMGAYEFDGGGHVRPTADAGPDQRVFDEVLLDGSGSHDPDGTIVTYQWQLVHRENPAYNRTATGINPTVSNLHPGFYDVTLTVTDNTSLTDTDTMLLSAIGKMGDLNRDGHVDGADLQIFSTVYGR